MLKINLSRNREEPKDEVVSPVNPAVGPEWQSIPSEPESKPVTDTLFSTVPEPERSPETAHPSEEEATEPQKSRREKKRQEKVPLSDRATDIPDEIRSAMLAVKSPAAEKEGPHSGGGGRKRVMVLAVVLVLMVGYFAWSQRAFMYGLIPAKLTVKTAAREKIKPSPKPVSTPQGKTAAAPSAVASTVKSSPSATAPPAPPPTSHAPAAPAVSDPVLSALAGISKATPPLVWLTSATARSDGAYELKGMSFSHEAMQSFAAALERRGAVTARDIPAEAKAPDAVYTFHLSGKLNDLRVPEILDALTENRLYALGDSLRILRKEADILVVRLPKAGKAYAESELPFELEGSYSALQKTLDSFLSNRGIIIDRIAIHPAASGKQYNRVRVSFSLRTISSI